MVVVVEVVVVVVVVRCIHVVHDCSRMYGHRPSLLYKVGTEHIGFLPTRHRLLVPSAERNVRCARLNEEYISCTLRGVGGAEGRRNVETSV